MLAHALGVLREDLLVQRVIRLSHLKGVREHAAFKGRVVAAHTLVVGVLDVDGHDVVRKQQDFVAVHLVAVLVLQHVVGDEIALYEVRHERARPRERVQDVHTVISERLAELAPEHAVSLAQNVVDNLGGRVDHTHLL